MKTWKCKEHGELESDEVTYVEGQVSCNMCLLKRCIREVEEIE